jgi:hypothetical protein
VGNATEVRLSATEKIRIDVAGRQSEQFLENL